MTMTGYNLAAQLHDAQGPPDPIECSHCDGSHLLEVAATKDAGGEIEDWPQELASPEVPCRYCLPEYRRGDDDDR